IFAWIIGWDLILEYALSASTVAVGWSGYFVSLCRDLGIAIPPALTAPRGSIVTLADGSLVHGVFNLPAAFVVLLVSALLVIGIAVAIVLLGIVNYRRLNVAAPLAVGIDATGLKWFSPVIKVSALFGLFSTMLVQLLAQTRIFYSMSRDGLLPTLFGVIHPRFRTPYLSTILTGSIIAFAAGLLPIGLLGQLVSIGTLLAFVLVCIGF